MEPFEYARLIRRRWRVVAACALVAAVAVWVVTPASPAEREPEFVAEHSIIREADPATSAPAQALATVALMVKTGEVPRRVATELGFTGEPLLLVRSIETRLEEQVGTLTVRATAKGKEQAADLANAFAESTLAVLGERAQQAREKTAADLSNRISRRQQTIDDLERQADEARGAGRSDRLVEAQRDAELALYQADLEQQQKQSELPPPSAGYVTLEPATADLARLKGTGFGVPSSRPARSAGAGLLGLVLGVLAVLVIDRVDPRIHLRPGAERAFRLPVVAEIPYASKRRRYDVLTATDPASAVAEAYRALRAALLLIPAQQLGEAPPAKAASRPVERQAPVVSVPSMLGPQGSVPSTPVGSANGDAAGPEEPHVVLVTSAAPSEGKTATVANLAASFAEAGRSVLVLSCDFRRPSIHEHLGVRQAWGLTEVLDAKADSPSLPDVIKETIIPGVRIATNGSPLDNFGEVAAEGRQLVTAARRHADIVLIDTAPLLVAHEATELIPAADTVVIVCRSGQTTKEEAGRARELLTRLGATVTGVVLIGAPENNASYSTYYQNEPGTHHRRSWFSRLTGRQPEFLEPDAPPPPGPAKKRAVI